MRCWIGIGPKTAAALAGWLIASALGAGAETAVLEATRDATLIESATGAFANGAGPAVFVGRTAQTSDSRRRSVIAFDVAGALPGGALVTGAWLELELSPSNPAPIAIAIHRVAAEWSEGPSEASGGSGALALPGDVTWIHRRYDGERWAQPGGDFAAEPSALTEVGDAGTYQFASTPALVADVQRWLDSPTSNAGWILVGGEEAASTSKRFYSREAGREGEGPRLVVDYVLPCDAADLSPRARGICNAYCEALDCDGAAPRGEARACEQLAHRFAAVRGGDAPPCEGPPDLDRDGVADASDNCPETANGDQADGDGDAVGNACDNCPGEPNPRQEDGFGTRLGDACDCPCFTSEDVTRLVLTLEDASLYTDLDCTDSTPTKPLTAVSAIRSDGSDCALQSADCSALAVSFTEDNACQINPPAPAAPVGVDGISDVQRNVCREFILAGALAAGVACE